MWRVTIDVIFAVLHGKRHVHDRWHKSGFTVLACLTDVCASHKLQTQWQDWCNGSSNGKYSSGDRSGAKTINVYMRFIKCNPCTGRLHLVLFHHSVFETWRSARQTRADWKVLDSHLSNKSLYPHQLPSGIIVAEGNKQTTTTTTKNLLKLCPRRKR